METEEKISATRSTFVTVVGWVFIAFAGFATTITVLQNVMLFMLFPLDELRRNPPDDAAFTDLPAWSRFLMTHMELWFLFCFAVSAITLIAAIGLVRRWNWARLLFVGVLLFGVVWNLVTPFLIPAMMPAEELARVDNDFRNMFLAMQVMTGLMAVGMAVLFGWIAWRLCSPTVRAEFVRE